MDKYKTDQALGYLILALEVLGKDEEEVRRIVSVTEDQTNVWAEEYAKEKYDEYYGD